jgi:hypothetical protein
MQDAVLSPNRKATETTIAPKKIFAIIFARNLRYIAGNHQK